MYCIWYTHHSLSSQSAPPKTPKLHRTHWNAFTFVDSSAASIHFNESYFQLYSGISSAASVQTRRQCQCRPIAADTATSSSTIWIQLLQIKTSHITYSASVTTYYVYNLQLGFITYISLGTHSFPADFRDIKCTIYSNNDCFVTMVFKFMYQFRNYEFIASDMICI